MSVDADNRQTTSTAPRTAAGQGIRECDARHMKSPMAEKRHHLATWKENPVLWKVDEYAEA